MDTNQADSILKRGCLVHLTCSIWGTKKKLPTDETAQGDSPGSVDPEYIEKAKFKMAKNYLRPIEKIRNEARSYAYTKSLSFPIPGLLFIPRDLISLVDSRLLEFKQAFDSAVDMFASQYPSYINEAQGKLGSLFNPTDYPQDIKKHFSFEWKFIILDAPNKGQLISPEIYEREKEKFEQTIIDFKETAVTALRTTFSEMVNRIVERLTGEKKVFRDSLIGNIKEFLDDFNSLNITDDTELASMVERCRCIIQGIDIDTIRTDDQFRQHIAADMQGVQAQLSTMMVNRPTRLIRKVG